MIETNRISRIKEIRLKLNNLTQEERASYRAGCDIIMSVMDVFDCGFDHKKRVADSYMARERVRITFSEARRRLGLGRARDFYAMQNRNELYRMIEVMHDTPTSSYCWEDDVDAVIARLITAERKQ